MCKLSAASVFVHNSGADFLFKSMIVHQKKANSCFGISSIEWQCFTAKLSRASFCLFNYYKSQRWHIEI